MQYSLIKHFLPSWARVCCEQYSLFMIPKLDEIHSGRKILFSCTFAFTWNIYETLILPKHEHWWKYKVLSLVEACFDLISPSSLSMKIQIIGGKITENLVFKSPLPKGNIFCPFSFHFQILHKKLHIFVFNHFWISCFTNQISIKTKIFNMFYLISN